MNKRQKKIEVIKKYISNAAGNWSAYSYGNIPSKQLSNACYSYAGAIEKEDVLGLIDITVLGNGKKGMLFTENKVYYDNGVLAGKGSVSYKSISDKKIIPSDIMTTSYNETALREMIDKLVEIEEETLSKTVSEVGDAVVEMLEGVQEVQNIYNMGKDFLSTLGLFDDEKSNK